MNRTENQAAGQGAHGESGRSESARRIEESARESLRWIEEQESQRSDRLRRERQAGESRTRRSLVTTVLLLTACALCIAWGLTSVFALDPSPPDIRNGTYLTDGATDNCIHNLWIVSQRIQQGAKDPVADLVCPVTRKPYVIRKAGEGWEAHCPNPETHGFDTLRVTETRPIPELKP